jgi:maleate cis-trans isomerase
MSGIGRRAFVAQLGAAAAWPLAAGAQQPATDNPVARMAMPRHFGMLIPSTNTMCEMEFGRLPLDLQAHTARLGKAGNTPFSPSLDADVIYQSKMLGSARVEVIALVQTSASLFSDDYDAETIKRMTEASGVPALTSAQGIGRALRALGTSRVAIATPYSEEVIGRAKHYYETKYGISVIATQSLGASDAYAIGKMDPGVVQTAFDRIDRPDIEALMVPGGNFPTMDWIAQWEQRYAKPVITTNQATLWAVLKAMQIASPLAGRGRLLEKLPEG